MNCVTLFLSPKSRTQLNHRSIDCRYLDFLIEFPRYIRKTFNEHSNALPAILSISIIFLLFSHSTCSHPFIEETQKKGNHQLNRSHLVLFRSQLIVSQNEIHLKLIKIYSVFLSVLCSFHSHPILIHLIFIVSPRYFLVVLANRFSNFFFSLAQQRKKFIIFK